MGSTTIGVLHPGAMGAAVARTLRNGGHDVVWASAGRGNATRDRADRAGLRDVGSVHELCRVATIVMSVCPPHAASDVARDVLAAGFHGTFVDANAISPERSCAMGELVEGAGASFVDGGIIGVPPERPGATWLHLSGARAPEVAAAFIAGPLEVEVVSGRVGDASAIKMCFAAYTKGSTALIATTFAAAHHHGVLEQLRTQWDRVDPDFFAAGAERVRRATAKAWRFEGEMREIDATIAGAGAPAGFHAAAAVAYGRLERFKDDPQPPDLETILAALLGS
ncbi:MAG: NAD(P)-dependent oxidoreductase [Trueperaceae bacterium]|nr:NAD(P)-dependent oxidoreductase [Trueperaceae bacterium]